MNLRASAPGRGLLAILFVALALSIGWGVRGNWGHEYGAMIPGALAAMAAVLVSGREDWQRRIGFFAFFGALGWSFGGSISYMQVIAYTHSGHGPSVIYGLACLFLIGFLWAAMGGAGTALPAFLTRQRLTELLIPTAVVLLAWVAQDIFFHFYLGDLRERLNNGSMTAERFREQVRWIEWNDTDWIAVLVAGGALLVLAIARRRLCWGTRLALAMCGGWWLGFTVLVLGLGLRMTPPRGDNWAGALGMTLALLIFLYQTGELGILWAALVTGLFGGLGFTGATVIKLILVNPAVQQRIFGGETRSNWHSILEQTFGFISGIGVGVAMAYLSTRAPRHADALAVRRWADPLVVWFVMIVITYVNISKNVEAAWLAPKGSAGGNMTLLQPEMWGHSSYFWFNLGYLALAIAIAWPLVAFYRGRQLAVLPASPLGKGQLFFVVFLWWIVIGNLARTVPFAEQRLITE
ncbi:MAG TPA: hypothetical protein VHV08_02165, partial [Pirellulales bacterium]|nr:hypothetical protein [Pirellulales bacterium]